MLTSPGGSGTAARQPPREVDVVVVGGGQAALATGYYLRRAGLEPESGYVILDAGEAPGGAWRHMWPSLTLFSPAEFSSLPGWRMPMTGQSGMPPAAHVVDYLTRYEQRYDLPVHRPARVTAVRRPVGASTDRLAVESSEGVYEARAVVSATGTWGRPFVPHYPGMSSFRGLQLHSADYVGPDRFAGLRVVIVGGGNTGAQLLAEVSTVAETTWVTQRPPVFLPDDVDGRALFAVATARRKALDAGLADSGGVRGLGDVVMVPSVREARDRGVLHASPMFERLTPKGVAWADGTHQPADAIVWCTGFRPDLGHLAPLGLRGPDGRIPTAGTRSLGEPRLHLVGYGDWTGPGSATLIGVGRTAREAVDEITALLGSRS
ncbi:ArsO family NAD(P)H-dependent flavin-containing monooxygenase [Knoellia aerolata]|uniref:FAD-dependent pyridine nucleotide-disulfide oxidoreductase n=1 Tax=Knoellia aerolata DSM 18566 TaxID=1385519 RepID=A0A0A0JKM2_9MICO|nr:ArsO family NAD(P)H-dependent flavin-containing monooxygenase [Knoellia aerolata]KGN37638.1 FAD-dependent pyridine nucleotide-disulfide oxidoreductase [Knoellia aerolata DSM 18566]